MKLNLVPLILVQSVDYIPENIPEKDKTRGQSVKCLLLQVKHAQCFDVALMDDGSVVLASKDYRLYIYRYIQVPPLGL